MRLQITLCISTLTVSISHVKRVSATDWLEESLEDEPSWTAQDTVRLAGMLPDHGVDLLDVSSGGLHPAQKIEGGGPAYQARFAEIVKKAHGHRLFVASVGAITDGKTAQGVLDKVRFPLYFSKSPVLNVSASGPG